MWLVRVWICDITIRLSTIHELLSVDKVLLPRSSSLKVAIKRFCYLHTMKSLYFLWIEITKKVAVTLI